MNKLAVYATVALAPVLLAATLTQGNLYGRYNERVYQAPGKLFRMSSPFPDDPVVSDGREPANNNAGAVSFIDSAGRMLGVLYMEDKGAGKAVVARGKHYYLLQTELRIEKLAAPDWRYDEDGANWNVFVPELEALYDRIEFLKP